MSDKDFYNDNQFVDPKYRFDTKKAIKVLIISIIAIICFISINKYLYKANRRYTMDVVYPSTIYMGETAEIKINLQGSNKYKDSLMTNLNMSGNEEIISLEKSAFKGKSETIPITTIKSGTEQINISSIVKEKKKDVTAAEKSIEITVCPAFDVTLFPEQITVKKDSVYNLDVNYGDGQCKENITYQSSDKNIMVVSDKGVIIGVSKGTANMIVSKGDKKIVKLIYVN